MVSVVIPVYNAASSLGRCLDSILNQSVECTLEIVAVNDGSKDDSLSILRQYEAKYNNIIVIDKPNGGVSSARNKGIECARGEWLMFTDADDYWQPNTLSLVLAQMQEQNNPDLCICGLRRLSRQGKENVVRLPLRIYECEEKLNMVASLDAQIMGSPCNKIYKRQIVMAYEIRFDTQVKMGEDAIFNFNYLRHCNRAMLSDVMFYNYDVNWSSATIKFHGEGFLKDAVCYKNAQMAYVESERKKYGDVGGGGGVSCCNSEGWLVCVLYGVL